MWVAKIIDTICEVLEFLLGHPVDYLELIVLTPFITSFGLAFLFFLVGSYKKVQRRKHVVRIQDILLVCVVLSIAFLKETMRYFQFLIKQLVILKNKLMRIL